MRTSLKAGLGIASLILILVSVVSAQEITSIHRKVGAYGGVEIAVNLDDARGKWLGCTVFPQNEDCIAISRKEIDLTAQRVPRRNRVVFDFQALCSGTYLVTAALWEKKVTREECAARRDGEPCEYCWRNGYHLEGEIDRIWEKFVFRNPFE